MTDEERDAAFRWEEILMEEFVAGIDVVRAWALKDLGLNMRRDLAENLVQSLADHDWFSWRSLASMDHAIELGLLEPRFPPS